MTPSFQYCVNHIQLYCALIILLKSVQYDIHHNHNVDNFGVVVLNLIINSKFIRCARNSQKILKQNTKIGNNDLLTYLQIVIHAPVYVTNSYFNASQSARTTVSSICNLHITNNMPTTKIDSPPRILISICLSA